MRTINSHSALRRRFITAGLAIASSVVPATAPRASDAASESAAYTHRTAPTQFIDAGGARLAFRRFGKPGGVPLILFQHLGGNMDNWDPRITDGFAQDREVILFDNAGVASSSGEVPRTIEGLAKVAINLIDALHISNADLLGFSIGSFIAQEVTVERPDLVHRLILEGSAPRGGIGMASLTPEFQAMLSKKRDNADTLLLDALFSSSEVSQAAGRAFLIRKNARTIDRDVDLNPNVVPAHIAAINAWGVQHPDSYKYLKTISQPVLVISGSNDVVFYTANAFILEQNLRNAQLIIYPDTGHAPMDQYPDLFVKHVSMFLNEG